MSDLKRISELMDADPDWRKLLRKRKPKKFTAPWPDAVVDRLPSGEDVEVVTTRGPAKGHQCRQALTLYRAGRGIEAIAVELSITPEQANAWIRQAMGVR